MQPSVGPLAIGLTVCLGSLTGIPAMAQDWLPSNTRPQRGAREVEAQRVVDKPPSRQTSRLGGPITPTRNPFVQPYTNTVPASRPPSLTSETERPSVIIRQDRNSTVRLEAISEGSGPAPFLQEQPNTGVQVIQVGP